MQYLQLLTVSVFGLLFLNNVQDEISNSTDYQFEESTFDTLKISIEQDTSSNNLFKIINEQKQPILYFRNITMSPCKNDKCEIMNLKMYWDINGEFFKFELSKGQRLTKLNHKGFTDKEYVKLHNILLDTTSDFRFLKLEDLTEHQAENSFYETDAVSGATINNRDFECINGAVKTTYLLWHFANGEVTNDIKQLESNHQKNSTHFAADNNSSPNIFDKTDLAADKNIYWLSKYLSNLNPELDNTKKTINNLANNLLPENNWNALLIYNFLIRNGFSKPKKQLNFYKKQLLIKQIKPNTPRN